MPESPVVGIRLNGALADEIQTRAKNEQSLSSVARRDLERYYEMLRRSLPKFSVNDARILVGALNGVIVMPQSASLLWANVEDYLRGQGLSDEDFVERLRSLTPFECMAIADAVERFYAMPGTSSLEEMLRKVGLVR